MNNRNFFMVIVGILVLAITSCFLVTDNSTVPSETPTVIVEPTLEATSTFTPTTTVKPTQTVTIGSTIPLPLSMFESPLEED